MRSSHASPPRRGWPRLCVQACAWVCLLLAAPAHGGEPTPEIQVRLAPDRARPGELFAVEVAGGRLQAPAARLGKVQVPMFAAGEDLWRGYGAVPVDAEPGELAVEVKTRRAGKALSASAPFAVEEKAVTEHELSVARKFTSPSPEQRRQMLVDSQAFREAYKVRPGPPLFDSNFLDPRSGAERNSRFGEKRVFNGKLQSRHMGLDLDGKVGDPILAANDGVVRMARSCFASGKTVILSHGAGLFTGYFHLSAFKVRVGQAVKKGQVIGLLGVTGRVTGPHLHLSAKVNSVTFDPESLLTYDFFPAVAAEQPKPAEPAAPAP